MQVMGQMAIEDDDDHETEHIAGTRRGKDGRAHGKVVLLHPTTNGCEVVCPPGVSAHVHRVVDGKAHVNLVIDLSNNDT